MNIDYIVQALMGIGNVQTRQSAKKIEVPHSLLAYVPIGVARLYQNIYNNNIIVYLNHKKAIKMGTLL